MKLTNEHTFLHKFFGFFSCNSKKNKQRTPSEMLIDWKNDSLGCLRVRNDSSFKLITDSIKIIGKSYNEALLMFGKPNKIYKTKDGAVISYFLNTRCGGTLTETECFARFDFEVPTEILSCAAISSCLNPSITYRLKTVR